MHSPYSRPTFSRKLITLTLAGLLAASVGWAAKNPIKPGFNLFSKAQDVELGKEASAEIEQQVEVVDDRELTEYISRIGNRLAKSSQDPSYPFTFKVVADPGINAFALPGGPIYVNSGLIAQADNEAQLAGVMSHEIGHVVLRHSTNRASKSSLFKLPALIAGGALNKKGGMLASLGQVGLGFGLQSVLLKYSRKAEHDSDIVGARMMADVGYDPEQAALFFKKLEQSGGARGPQFLATHPNPGNRTAYIREEIADYPPKKYTTTTREFARMKARAVKIKPSKKPDQAEAGQGGTSEAVTTTAKGDSRYQGRGYALVFPQGWQAHQGSEGPVVTIVPANGVVKDRNGKTAIARGVLAGVFDEGRNQKDATTRLIANLEKTNPGLRAMADQRQAMRFGGRPGESLFLEGTSPVKGQAEYVWMVTSFSRDGLFYMLMISPESEYDELSRGYEEVVRSVQFE